MTGSFADFVPAFSSGYVVESFAFNCAVEFEVLPGICSEVVLFQGLAGYISLTFEPVGSLLWVVVAGQEDMLAVIELV